MKQNKISRHLLKGFILCISLFVLSIPTFAVGAPSTIDDIIGNYTGTLMNGERGTLVEASVEKTTAATGFVTITGVEGQLEPTTYFMTFDSSNSNFRLYPNTVTKETTDIDSLPFSFIGIFIDDAMFGQHALYNTDENMAYPTNNISLHKVTSPNITLTEDALNKDNHMPFNLIEPAVGMTTLKNNKIDFYEYESGFSSMRISFTAESANTGYLYMVTLAEDVDIHLTAKSPITTSAVSFDDDFGRFVASSISGDYYGPWNYVDPLTAAELKKTYVNAILNQLGDESVLGRNYYRYNSHAGVLAGNTDYELEIMFKQSLEELFTVLEEKPGAIYIGGPNGELLLDDLKPSDDWRRLLEHYGADTSGNAGIASDCIKNVPLSDYEASDLFSDLFYESLKGPETRLIDEEEMTVGSLNKIVSLTKNGQSTIVALDDPNNKDIKFMAVFDEQQQLKFFMARKNERLEVQVYFEQKVGILESNKESNSAVYNEFPKSDHVLSTYLKSLLNISEELIRNNK